MSQRLSSKTVRDLYVWRQCSLSRSAELEFRSGALGSGGRGGWLPGATRTFQRLPGPTVRLLRAVRVVTSLNRCKVTPSGRAKIPNPKIQIPMRKMHDTNVEIRIKLRGM